MAEHEQIEVYDYEALPLDCDVFLMDEQWRVEYEDDLLGVVMGRQSKDIGEVAFAAVRSIKPEYVELSWYPNVFDRFHEVRVYLPRLQFVKCVSCSSYDIKPTIFVGRDWLDSLYEGINSVFALVDAANFGKLLVEGNITRDKLLSIRSKIDKIAADNPAVAFVSLGDSVLIKMNWLAGDYADNSSNSYRPEFLIKIISEIAGIFREVLDLNVYAVITQGSNGYYSDGLIYSSPSRNHISLNSLGLPFAQLISIDTAARHAIRERVHGKYELYMERSFYISIRFKSEFDRDSIKRYSYKTKLLSEQAFYVTANRDEILSSVIY